VRPTDDIDVLTAALDGLTALAGQDDRAALAELRERLGQGRLRVLVAGEAERAKSTLVNALLGRQVLPSGVTPLTALATAVRYGPDESVTAVFRDGRAEIYQLSDLDDLVTERGQSRKQARPGVGHGERGRAVPGLRSRVRRHARNRVGVRAQHLRGRASAGDDGRGRVRADRRPAGVGQRAGSRRAAFR
jgi:hypothetical protein